MTPVVRTLKLLALGAIWLIPAIASAVISNPTPQRSYVSLAGSDSNNCGAANPCRTWQAALAQTQPGGEILTLNSGGFGLLNITQAVTLIVPPGVYGGMSPPSGSDGVVISAPTTARVVLRGVTINGQGGVNGVNIVSAGSVLIEDATIENMQVGVLAASAGSLEISRSNIRGNAGRGIQLAPGTGGLNAGINQTQVTANGTDGIGVTDGVLLLLSNSRLVGNGTSGSGWGLNMQGSASGSGAAADVRYNVFASNASGGIALDDTSSASRVAALLQYNDLINGGVDIQLTGATQVDLAWNSIHTLSNGTSVSIAGTAIANTSGNNIIGGNVVGTLTAQAFR